jgi:hypothetical protein
VRSFQFSTSCTKTFHFNFDVKCNFNRTKTLITQQTSVYGEVHHNLFEYFLNGLAFEGIQINNVWQKFSRIVTNFLFFRVRFKI